MLPDPVILQFWALPFMGWVGNGGIEVADFGFYFRQYFVAPVANFLSEAAPGGPAILIFGSGHAAGAWVGFAVFLGVNERAKLDDVCHGIEVEGVGFAAQPRCFKGNGAPAGKHIEDAGARGAPGADVVGGHFLACLAGEALGMRLQDVALGFSGGAFDVGLLLGLRVAGVLAEPFDELCGICATKGFLFVVARSIRDKLGSRHECAINCSSAGHGWS